MPKKSEEWKQRAELPWRKNAPPTDAFQNAKLRASNEPGQGPTMYLPPSAEHHHQHHQSPRERLRERMRNRRTQEEDGFGFDPRLKYAFSKNFQFLRRVFSVDTILMPLPSETRRNVARNLGFFTRIFTQFFDPRGIQNAQKSIGLGREERIRHVR